MLVPVLHLFLVGIIASADESTTPIAELPQKLTISSQSEYQISLGTESSPENECNLGSYACRMICVNNGICYKNDSNNLQFFLIGDTGGLPIYPYTTYAQKLVAKSLANIGDKKNIEFTISVGDNIYFTGVKDEFDGRFQETFENVYKGKALEKPWYLIAGNHDHFGNISGQIAYTNRSQRWTYPASYYKVSYAFGKNATLVEFLMIDTILLCGNTRDITEAGFIDMIFATVQKNPNMPKDPVAAKTQLDWIEQQLSSSRADYLFVVGHYPLYSISEHGSMNCLIEKVKPLLEKYHATAYHIVTEHSLGSDDVEKIQLHYIVSGAGSRSDHSVKHMDTIPEGSLRFNYPTGFNPVSQLGLSTGGFICADMDREKAIFTFYNGKGKQKYSCIITPRKNEVRGMLQVEVMPGCGIRNDYIELLLGMPINQAIAAIQNASRYIQNVELTYSSKEPLSRDIMIRLTKDGIRLYFEPNTQLLRLIEVYDLSNIILQYGGVVFSSPKDEADVNKVEGCFGATHPGVYVAEQSLYELSWKGLSFSFPTLNETSKVQTSSIDATGLGSLQFRSNSPPLLAKMAIYSDTYNSPKPPKISAASLCGVICPVEVKSISDGSRISGLFFIFAAETPLTDSSSRKQAFGLRKIERSIFFGDTSESVLSSLGTPSKVFYTKADRMLIHRGEDSKKLRGPRPNYFFNYFSLGVDILFDCITNRVQKFVLHTNLPGHFDFGIYARCNFCIAVTGGPIITPSSKRENFLGAFCGDTTVQPVVLSRSGTENPFGSTFCYGTNQIIVEVMDNGFIASVTLF